MPVFHTKTIEGILDPVAQQVSRLVILYEEGEDGAAMPDLTRPIHAVSNAVANLVKLRMKHFPDVACKLHEFPCDVASRLQWVGYDTIHYSEDMILKQDMPPALTRVEEAAKSLEQACSELSQDPYSHSGRKKLIDGARGILQGTSSLLLCFDESEVRKIIRSCKKVLDYLAVAEVIESMDDLIQFVKDISPWLTRVSKDIDLRQRELTHQVHREILLRCMESVKTLAPILICSMKIFIQIHGSGGKGIEEAGENRNYVVSREMDEINEIIRVLQLTSYDEEEWDADNLTVMRKALNAIQSLLQAALDWLADPRALRGGIGEKSIRRICQLSQRVADHALPEDANAIRRACSDIGAMTDSLAELRQNKQGDTPQATGLARGIADQLKQLIGTKDQVGLLQQGIQNVERSGFMQPAHTIAGRLDQALKWLENPSVDDRGFGLNAIRLITEEGRNIAKLCTDPERTNLIQLCDEIDSLAGQLADLQKRGMQTLLVALIRNRLHRHLSGIPTSRSGVLPPLPAMSALDHPTTAEHAIPSSSEPRYRTPRSIIRIRPPEGPPRPSPKVPKPSVSYFLPTQPASSSSFREPDVQFSTHVMLPLPRTPVATPSPPSLFGTTRGRIAAERPNYRTPRDIHVHREAMEIVRRQPLDLVTRLSGDFEDYDSASLVLYDNFPSTSFGGPKNLNRNYKSVFQPSAHHSPNAPPHKDGAEVLRLRPEPDRPTMTFNVSLEVNNFQNFPFSNNMLPKISDTTQVGKSGLPTVNLKLPPLERRLKSGLLENEPQNCSELDTSVRRLIQKLALNSPPNIERPDDNDTYSSNNASISEAVLALQQVLIKIKAALTDASLTVSSPSSVPRNSGNQPKCGREQCLKISPNPKISSELPTSNRLQSSQFPSTPHAASYPDLLANYGKSLSDAALTRKNLTAYYDLSRSAKEDDAFCRKSLPSLHDLKQSQETNFLKNEPRSRSPKPARLSIFQPKPERSRSEVRAHDNLANFDYCRPLNGRSNSNCPFKIDSSGFLSIRTDRTSIEPSPHCLNNDIKSCDKGVPCGISVPAGTSRAYADSQSLNVVHFANEYSDQRSSMKKPNNNNLSSSLFNSNSNLPSSSLDTNYTALLPNYLDNFVALKPNCDRNISPCVHDSYLCDTHLPCQSTDVEYRNYSSARDTLPSSARRVDCCRNPNSANCSQICQGGQPEARALGSQIRTQLMELKTLMQRTLTELVVENFADLNSPLKLFVDAACAPEDEPEREPNFISRSRHLQMTSIRAAHTGRLVATAGGCPDKKTIETLCLASSQVASLTPQVLNAGKIRLHYPTSPSATEHFDNIKTEFADALHRLRALVDEAMDTCEFLESSITIMRRYTVHTETAIERSEPQGIVDSTSHSARLGNRVVMIGRSEAENSEDHRFVSEITGATDHVQRAIPPMIQNAKQLAVDPRNPNSASQWRDSNNRLIEAVSELRTNFMPEKVPLYEAPPQPRRPPSPPAPIPVPMPIPAPMPMAPPPQPPSPPRDFGQPQLPASLSSQAKPLAPGFDDCEADEYEMQWERYPLREDDRILGAAHSLHQAIRQWSSRENEIVGAAKRMAILMARLSQLVRADSQGSKKDLIDCAIDIAKASEEVARLAYALARRCTDKRMRGALLQVSERIPTIGTQLKILSTVKATMLGSQATEDDQEAMELLVLNAQNLMQSVKDTVRSAESASIKVRTDSGIRLRWMRKVVDE